MAIENLMLSIEYWTLRQYKAYDPILKNCNLGLKKKLAIIDDPDKRAEQDVRTYISMSPPKQV